jgi:hypothetical protein
VLVLPAKASDASLSGRLEDGSLHNFAMNPALAQLRLLLGNRDQSSIVNGFHKSIPQGVEGGRVRRGCFLSPGSGRGLAIAKKIVEDHGGEIYLDGRTGTGPLFKITIPFAFPRRAIPLTSVGPIRSTRISRGMARGVNTFK